MVRFRIWVQGVSMAGRSVLGQSLWAELRTARQSVGFADDGLRLGSFYSVDLCTTGA